MHVVVVYSNLFMEATLSESSEVREPTGFWSNLFKGSQIDTLNSVSAIEIELRRRARRCRRYSWIFLTGILGAVAAASIVVFQFLADVTTAQSAVLSEIADDIDAISRPISEELDQLNGDISVILTQMRVCLLELGACFAETSQPGVTDADVTDVMVSEGVIWIVARDRGALGMQVWRSEDGGARWSKGGFLSGFRDGSLGEFDGTIVFSGRVEDGINDQTVVLDSLGHEAVRISEDFEVTCEGGSGSRVSSNLVSPGTFILRNCNDATVTNLRWIDLVSASHTILPDVAQDKINSNNALVAGFSDGTVKILTLKNGNLRRLTFTPGETSWVETDLMAAQGRLVAHDEMAILFTYSPADQSLKLTTFDNALEVQESLTVDFDGQSAAMRELVNEASQPQEGFFSRQRQWSSAELPDGSVLFWLKSDGRLFDRALHVGTAEGEPFARLVSDVPLAPGAALVAFESGTLLDWEDFGQSAVMNVPLPPWDGWPHVALVSQTEKGWIIVQSTDLAAEKSVRVWRWSPDVGWRSVYLPARFEIKPIWGGWNAALVGNRLFLAAEELQSDHLRIFVSETTDLSVEMFEERADLMQFLETASSSQTRTWTERETLLDKLRREADLSATANNLVAALAPITSRLEARRSEGETPAALLTSFSSEFLFIALARLLILALIFFAVRILTNLYRYFLRLSAYYDARADGLALARAPGEGVKERMPDNVADIFSALSPDLVDLGTSPKGPTTEVVEAATKLAEAAARTVAGKSGT